MIPRVIHTLKPGDTITMICPLAQWPFEKSYTCLIIGQGKDLWIKNFSEYGPPWAVELDDDYLFKPMVDH